MSFSINKHLFLALAILIVCPSAFASPTHAIVIVPLADVRSEPSLPPRGRSDDKEETQLFFGDHVRVHETKGDWLRIETPFQSEFTHHDRWEGYPGWVLKNSVAFLNHKQGSRLAILDVAEALQGTPYYWGGLSAKDPSGRIASTGIDCSGLTYLAYRLNGWTIPRDAHEQWLKAKKVKRTQLRPADLIFSASVKKPEKIIHVTLYAGDGQVIEAPQTGMTVRKISFLEKYGQDFTTVESGDTIGKRILYFGRFLKKKD